MHYKLTFYLIVLLCISNLHSAEETPALKLITDPPGADIYLGDVLYGKTPKLIENISIGLHTLKFTKQYYQDSTCFIIITEEYQNAYHYNLKIRKTGTIKVNHADGAYVSLDGTLLGKAPGPFKNIEYGRHLIAIQTYLSDIEKYIEITNDSTVIVNASYNTYVTIEGKPKDASILLNTDFHRQLNRQKDTLIFFYGVHTICMVLFPNHGT